VVGPSRPRGSGGRAIGGSGERCGRELAVGPPRVVAQAGAADQRERFRTSSFLTRRSGGADSDGRITRSPA